MLALSTRLAFARRSGAASRAASAARARSRRRATLAECRTGAAHMQTRAWPQRSSAPTSSFRWRPRPPTPYGAGHDATTWPVGSTASCACSACGREKLDVAPPLGRATSGGSAEVVIAPQRDQVTPEILAESEYLPLEAASQLEHELLIRRRRRGLKQSRAERVQQALAHLSGGARPRERHHAP